MGSSGCFMYQDVMGENLLFYRFIAFVTISSFVIRSLRSLVTKYDIVSRVIKLIPPCPSCDNQYLSHTLAFIRAITGWHKNNMSRDFVFFVPWYVCMYVKLYLTTLASDNYKQLVSTRGVAPLQNNSLYKISLRLFRNDDIIYKKWTKRWT